MTRYEKALLEISEIVVEDQVFLSPDIKGLYTNKYGSDIILINRESTQAEKLCILVEELGHYYTSYGNITDQSDMRNRKQELVARRWAYDKLIKIEDFIAASQEGIINRYELAEYLGVTEAFLMDVLTYYKAKYGPYYQIDNYLIYFDPLTVVEKFF